MYTDYIKRLNEIFFRREKILTKAERAKEIGVSLPTLSRFMLNLPVYNKTFACIVKWIEKQELLKNK